MNKNRIRQTILTVGLSVTLAGLGCASAALASSPAADGSATAAPAASTSNTSVAGMLQLINNERAANGLNPVTWSQPVADSVQPWADHIAALTADPTFNGSMLNRADEGGSVIPAGSAIHHEVVTVGPSAGRVQMWWDGQPTVKAKILDPNINTIGIGYTAITSGPFTGLNSWVLQLDAYAAAPTAAFTDINGSIFINEITWMKTAGISTGYGNGTYNPSGTVNRDAMAAFLYRLAGSPAYTAPATSPFSDVKTTDQFYKEMAWLKDSGISTGWDNGNGTFSYKPLSPVNRDAMAAFMSRFAGGLCKVTAASSYTAPSTASFTDVPPGSLFYNEISWMKTAGISTGYGDGTYKTVAPVSREAMAAFMYRLNNFVTAHGGCGVSAPVSTPAPTATPTATPTETASPIPTPTDTASPVPTDTPTATATPTDTATAVPTDTATATPTDTPTTIPAN